MSQRIDYVRQNIEKFARKNTVDIKSDKTPSKITSSRQQVNDENRPNNSNTKQLNGNVKQLNSNSKFINHHQINGIKNSPTLDRKQITKVNLANKINNAKNQLTNDKQIDSKQSIIRRLSNGRRQSNEKSTNMITNDKPAKTRLSNEIQIIPIDRQISKTTNDKNQQKSSTISASNDKLNQHSTQIKSSIVDKPIKTQTINPNEDPNKHRLLIENDLLKLKYFNWKCETKLRKQNQLVIEIVRSIFNLIEQRQANCLKLEQQLALKENLLFAFKLSEDSLIQLRDANLDRIEIYLKLANKIIQSALSAVKIVNLNNASNINDILKMTTSKLTSDLKKDTVQEFTDKIKNFDLIKMEIAETINDIRNIKMNSIDEINRRIELKNIY